MDDLTAFANAQLDQIESIAERRQGAIISDLILSMVKAHRAILARHKRVDFDGRTGYITTALEANVPIVPAVSIGGQESQLFLSRGKWLTRALGLTKLERKLFRTNILPITFGFPFGLSVLAPVNMPLPTKIVTEVLPPIDLAAKSGEAPDIKRLDAHVRWVMQKGLKTLAAQRHFPVIG